MVYYCTYCSSNKKSTNNLLPAILRYKSRRIKWVNDLANRKGYEMLILSGKYGLIEAELPIPYYDHLLTKSELKKHILKIT